MSALAKVVVGSMVTVPEPVKPAVEGTKAIMAAAVMHKVKRVVYTGSISSMYDFPEVPNPINESHWSDPNLPSISAYN